MKNPYAHFVSNQICDIAMASWHFGLINQPIDMKVPPYTVRSCSLWHQTEVNVTMAIEVKV